jgi:anti-sigma28 factor (negative regulator of flagellin synthesis)
MNTINPHISSVPNIQGLTRTAPERNLSQVGNDALPIKDSVSFSAEALKLSDSIGADTGTSNIRFDLVNRIKSEIAAGTYDTPDKMDAAVEKMAAKIFG